MTSQQKRGGTGDGLDHSKCMFSTGICGSTTAGQGRLDENGYWSVPCMSCAADLDRRIAEHETAPTP